jgi:hypothetical protein
MNVIALIIGLLAGLGQTPPSLYVASTGSDANDCRTPATACASFDLAYHLAAPGEVVEIAGGTYPPQVFSDDASKTSPVDVVLRAAPGAKVTVGCDGPHNCLATDGADHLTVAEVSTAALPPINGMERQGGVSIDRGSADVTYSDIDAGHIFIAGRNSAVVGGDYGPTVDEVSKTSEDSGPNILIDGARFHDFQRDTGHMECIAVHGARKLTIRRSEFDTCSVFSIFFTPEPSQHFHDVLIENNVFSNSSGIGMSAHVKVGSHGGDCTRFHIRNNTFVDDNVISDCGLGPDQGNAVDVRWIGNIFEDFDGGKCDFGGHVFDYNVIERGRGCGRHDRVVGDARFVDRAALNFRLRAGSPAINRGNPDDHPGTDIDGDVRPFGGAPDAGADEHGASGGTPDEAAPGLTLTVARRTRLGRLLRRGLRLRARCSERCLVDATLEARGRSEPVARIRARLRAGRPARLALRVKRAARAYLRAGGPRITLKAAASDPIGNTRRVRRALTVTP